MTDTAGQDFNAFLSFLGDHHGVPGRGGVSHAGEGPTKLQSGGGAVRARKKQTCQMEYQKR